MDFVDKNFNSAEYTKYRLSIQVSLNGFSFCIFDINSQKHVMVKDYVYSKIITDNNVMAKEIGELIENIPIKNIPTKCLFISPKNIFIPEEVFVENKLRAYMSFLFPMEELDEIHFKYISLIKGYCNFAIPSTIVSEFRKYFDDIKFYSQAYQSVYETMAKEGSEKMRVVLCENFIDITIVKDNVMLINNSFEIGGITDIVYFISALTDKFNLRNNIPIYVSGEILNTDIKELKKYFPSLIKENEKRISLLFGYDTSSKHYNLLSLHKCE